VIRDADCVVLPSYYPEGLPRVLLESISMETPVISTDTRGCRDAIENGRSGFLAKPRDSADLAKQMIEFYKMSPDARTAMGRYGRQKALTEFDDKIINHKYLDLLESAIGVGP
jgi:glycosyltransferase involved in cell wall biosynthesis